MAVAASSGAEMPANQTNWPGPPTLRVGPDTAQYGWVWPNEWPNGEVHTRGKEAADRARDGRDREHVRRGGGAPNRYQTTGTATGTGGALSGEFDTSFPAGSRRRMIAGSLRQPRTWATSGSRRAATSPTVSVARRATRDDRSRSWSTRQRAAHYAARVPADIVGRHADGFLGSWRDALEVVSRRGRPRRSPAPARPGTIARG
jgi:hypothetical protein